MTIQRYYLLVINSGSSSLKFSLLDVKSEAVIASGIAERLGTAEAFLKLSAKSSQNIREQLPNADHRAALHRVIDHLPTLAASEVDAIGHRIVHGGELFRDAVLVNDAVLNQIEALSDLAPLHNPPGAQGIRVASELFPNKPQVAVFDTAFHQTLPPHAFHYAIPAEFYAKYRARRYGFHGTSHQYVTSELARRLSRPIEELQIIAAHLGNGCSATAVKQGKSVDTTMGLTPLEGLVMGTRSGDVDPSLHLFLQQKMSLNLEEVTDLLTRKSGLLGVSGVSHDMRSVVEAIDSGNHQARLALDLFCYRLARAILGLAAGLENCARERVLRVSAADPSATVRKNERREIFRTHRTMDHTARAQDRRDRIFESAKTQQAASDSESLYFLPLSNAFSRDFRRSAALR